MRDLKKNDKNTLVINDARSGSEVELYYRNPTPAEEASYQSKLLKRKGNKVIVCSYDTRFDFGLRILTGFREGDFGFDGKPISSEKESPNYKEDWKEIVKAGAPDIVNVLAMTVFEGTRVSGATLDIEDETVVEETSPLAKS